MKFRNKKTNTIIDTEDKVLIRIYKNNSNFEALDADKTEENPLAVKTVDQLKEMAAEMKLDISKAKKKDEILAVIQEALDADKTEE